MLVASLACGDEKMCRVCKWRKEVWTWLVAWSRGLGSRVR